MTKRRVDLDTLLREASIKPHTGKLTLPTPIPKHREAFLRELADEFSVNIVIKERHMRGMKGFYAYALGETFTLFYKDIPSYAWFISCSFHEIGHIVVCRPANGLPQRSITMAKWVARSLNKKINLSGEVRATDNKAVLAKAKLALVEAADKGKCAEGTKFRVAIERDGEKHDEWTMVARSKKPKKAKAKASRTARAS